MKGKTKLLNSFDVAAGTKAFEFAKPAGFEFAAGNSIDLTLIDPPETDDEGNKRTFSLASAPYDETLMVATRMRDSAFKRTLGNAKPGHEIEFDGPYGDYVLHQNESKPAVFVIGG